MNPSRRQSERPPGIPDDTLRVGGLDAKYYELWPWDVVPLLWFSARPEPRRHDPKRAQD